MLKRIYRRLFRKKKTIKDYSESYIERLRREGATIGENVDILDSRIEGGAIAPLLRVGNNVTLTGVRILLHDASTYKCLGYTKVGEVTIGNDVFVGIGTIILPGTHIGNKVIIGSGAVVAKDIPDNSVAVGNPIRVICTYDEYMERQKARLESGVVLDYTLEELCREENAGKADELISAKWGFVK